MIRILLAALLVAGMAWTQQPQEEGSAASPQGSDAQETGQPAPQVAPETPPPEQQQDAVAEALKRPTEKDIRADKRVAAFWFIMPDK